MLEIKCSGRHIRTYGALRTPVNRVKRTGMWLPAKHQPLEQLYEQMETTELIRGTHQLQQKLNRLAEATL